ncbi:MAG TPA: AAA family ATPase [Candidatus Limnocylindrales bacterium]|nr:AAA family ATPase [Candidatus Limnocylindrales bacterium]
MRIRRLQVRDLRRYRELDIDLAPGVTVVRGPNEAGKSTIQRAIELALTRRVTSSAADLETLRPWDAGPDARPWVAIEFEQEEEDGRLATGTVEKWFGGQKGTVDLVYDGQRVTDPALADQVLAELSGIPTEAFFRSTASVRHHELSDLARDEAALRDRLQASISGADRGTGRAKKKLERAIFELATKGDKNPGRLKQAEATVARTAESVEKGELALARLEHDRDALSVAREGRRSAERLLSEKRAMLEKARQAERLEAERTAARERYERFREAVEVAKELEALGQTHPSPNPLPVIRQAVERLRVLDTRMRELRAALAGEIDVTFEVAPEPTWRPISRWGALAVIVGAIIGIGAFVADTLNVADLGMPPLYIGAALVLVGLILSGVALWLRRGSRMREELRDVEIDRRLRGRSEMEAELRQAEADTQQQLGTLGLDDLAAAADLLAREEAHVARIEQLSAQLDGLVGKEPRETLPRLRDGAALEIEQKTSAIEGLGPIAKEPRARERLEVEVRDQEAALDRSRDDEANARARVEANSVDAEQVAAEAERLSVWREQLALLQRKHRVLDATLRAIERAETTTMRTATRYLEGHMVRDVSTVTGGRYRRVRVDDKSLDIDVHAPERGDWVPVSVLSQGTLDLVYLTARLGLVRLVTGDRRPPLVFDDPFVTLDDDRATRALALLKRVADDFQIIYLTTSDRYDAAAHAVVELPGPATVDEGVDDPALRPVETASGVAG